MKALEVSQRKALEKLGLREVVYHTPGIAVISDGEGKPTEIDGGTMTAVLLLEGDEVVARGVSVRSPLDNFDKVHARVAARGRALRAIKRGANSGLTKARPDVSGFNVAFNFVTQEFGAKSMVKPKLTEFEENLLSGKASE